MDKYTILAGVAMFLIIGAVALAMEPTIAYTTFPAVFQATEYASPADRINLDNIHTLDSGFSVEISGATLYAIADTNSMEPAIDKEATVVAVKPATPDELIVGDIVIYRQGRALIIHRIIEIGTDSQGWYAIPKGDNNDIADSPISFDQVEAVVIGILY